MEEKILEHSSWLVEQEINTGIIRAQGSLIKPPGFDGEHCIEEDCGEQIPEPRLALGAYRCIECQSKHEHTEKLNKWLKP